MSLGNLNKIIIIIILLSSSVLADPIKKKIAHMKLLNKTTNKVSENYIDINKKLNWETLTIEIISCFSTPPDEVPENYVLLDVYDKVNNEEKNIYKGWMISSTPDVTSMEHPVYDLWLEDCK